MSDSLRPHETQHAKPPWSITNSRSPPKPMSIESVMPSNHLILCPPLLLPPSVFASIKVFSNESVLHIRGPKYWSFSFSISLSNEYSGLVSFKIDALISSVINYSSNPFFALLSTMGRLTPYTLHLLSSHMLVST